METKNNKRGVFPGRWRESKGQEGMECNMKQQWVPEFSESYKTLHPEKKNQPETEKHEKLIE